MTTDRDARSIQRRVDTLAAAALTMDDPSRPRIAEARGAGERLVIELTYRQLGEAGCAPCSRTKGRSTPYRSV